MLSTDGSNDTELEKMNPIIIRVFDEEASTDLMSVLHMCPSQGGTAEAFFAIIDGKLSIC